MPKIKYIIELTNEERDKLNKIIKQARHEPK